LVEILYP